MILPQSVDSLVKCMDGIGGTHNQGVGELSGEPQLVRFTGAMPSYTFTCNNQLLALSCGIPNLHQSPICRARSLAIPEPSEEDVAVTNRLQAMSVDPSASLLFVVVRMAHGSIGSMGAWAVGATMVARGDIRPAVVPTKGFPADLGFNEHRGPLPQQTVVRGVGTSQIRHKAMPPVILIDTASQVDMRKLPFPALGQIHSNFDHFLFPSSHTARNRAAFNNCISSDIGPGFISRGASLPTSRTEQAHKGSASRPIQRLQYRGTINHTVAPFADVISPATPDESDPRTVSSHSALPAHESHSSND